MTMERWRPGRGLIPWRPFRELGEMERRFEDILGRPFLPAVWRRIPMCLRKAELPGMKEEDIDISIIGDTLTIKGERKAESEVKEEEYYCCECSYGSCSRSIALPSNVDANKIEANYEDGVLEVSLPKAPEVKPKKVTVSAKKKEKASE
ncbi:Spore protein SP21 [subsurface metagenome]